MKRIVWNNAHTLGHLELNQLSPSFSELLQEDGEFALPCDFIPCGKFRNGALKYWCKTHQSPFGRKNDLQTGCCENAQHKFNVSSCEVFDLTDPSLEIAIWGAVSPFVMFPLLENVFCPNVLGGHVHLYKNNKKIVDKTFSCIELLFNDNSSIFNSSSVILSPPVLESFLMSNLYNCNSEHLQCSHCGTPHTDLKWFSVNEHLKHQCGVCGREFKSKNKCVSNALFSMSKYRQTKYQKATKIIDLSTKALSSDAVIKMWATTPPAIYTLQKEIVIDGIHLHVEDKGKKIIDETFKTVIYENKEYDFNLLMDIFYKSVNYKLSGKSIYTNKVTKNELDNFESSKCYVYILKNLSLYKIGYTSNLHKRIATIQTSSPFLIQLCKYWEFPTKQEAQKIEKRLHSQFKNKRQSGEWFSLSQEDYDVLTQLTTADLKVKE